MDEMSTQSSSASSAGSRLPRIAITYCTQCRWLLRAAYFAQELLSTFETAIGEVALLPATGGTFHIVVTHNDESDGDSSNATSRQTTIWDRKTDGGFPETKVLKQRLRDLIQPGRDLGHSDKKSDAQTDKQPDKGHTEQVQDETAIAGPAEAAQCKDC